MAMNQGKIRNLRVAADFDDDMQNVQGVITQYNEGNIEDCMVTGTISGYMGRKRSCCVSGIWRNCR